MIHLERTVLRGTVGSHSAVKLAVIVQAEHYVTLSEEYQLDPVPFTHIRTSTVNTAWQ
jgi:hypothetical protein